MTTYYVDPGAEGENDGTSWDDAWISLQSAADTAAAGDTVYCRGTQNLSAAIDFDTASGTYDGGYIKFIGCNASGVNDGTRFTLKRTANTINGIYVNGVSFVWLENISIEDCTGTAGIAVANAYSDKWRLINVRCHNNTGRGAFINSYGRYWSFHGCVFTANGGIGIYRPVDSKFHGCVFNGNGDNGVDQSGSNSYDNCIFHNNTGYGINFYNSGSFNNCVVDGNGGGGVKISYAAPDYMLTGCRITNHSASGKVGVDVTANTRVGLIGCYFGNNATDVTANRYDIIPINCATDHVILGGSDTNHGYTDQTADDFNLRSDASIRAYAVPLP